MKYILFGLAVIVGWNIFLIHRDNQMFDAYYGKTNYEQQN